jgi:hypothetical protein
MAKQNFDRMALNGAIVYLASGEEEHWMQEAQRLIDFAITIPSHSGSVIETVSFESRDKESVRGYAAGVGTVEVAANKKSPGTYETNAYMERIGGYRLVHLAKKNRIRIRHFKQMPPYRLPVDNGYEPDGYHLIYGQDRRPVLFVSVESRAVWGPLPLYIVVRSVLKECRRFIQALLEGRRYKPLQPVFVNYKSQFTVVHSMVPGLPKGFVFHAR